MRFTVLTSLLTIATLSRSDDTHQYIKPTDPKILSPCPLLNSLANMGYIDRQGKNIDLPTLIAAIKDAVNVGADFVEFSFKAVIPFSTTGNSSTIHLRDMVNPAGPEHMGSLAHLDTLDGDAGVFDAATWASTSSWLTKPTVTFESAAKARARRLETNRQKHPGTFQISDTESTITSPGETAVYLLVLGHNGNTAPYTYVDTFFSEERLPVHLGWKPRAQEIGLPEIRALTKKVLATK